MRPLVFIALAGAVAALSVLSALAEPSEGTAVQVGVFKPGQFIEPSACADCHSTIHGEWNRSVHSQALKDPVFQAISKSFYEEATSQSELVEAEMCIKCHSPAAFGTGLMTNPGEPFEKVTDATANGVFCDFCHAVAGLREVKNTGHLLDPGRGEDDPGTKRGPRDDAASEYHGSAFSDLHTRSEFCGGCHDVRHVVLETPLQSTYTEWLEGPYYTGNDETTVHCQDCHMRQAPGIPATGTTPRPDMPGKAAQDGPDRPHVWRHAVVGANAFLPGSFTDGGEHARMAEEQLKNCASLILWREGDWRRGGPGVVKVKVSNDGAGHYLPTGVSELRRMWLQIVVKDAKGALVYSSGVPDPGGYLPGDTVAYFMQMGDPEGRPTENITRADRVLWDYRIPPKGYRVETFRFVIPKKAAREMKVEARLRYRSLPAKILALLGEKAPQVHPVDMAYAAIDVNLVK